MKRLSRLTFGFAIVYTVLLVAPAFLSMQFGLYPLMKYGDVIDILTPLVLIPIYWLLFQMDEGKPPGAAEITIFLVLAGFWVEGQGMHLSANSIGHLLTGMEETDIYRLTHFYDEILSHYLWHIGVVGLSILLLWRQWHNPYERERSSLWWEGIGGFIYGFTYFLNIVEAGTAPLGVPFAALVVLFGFLRGRTKLRQQPILAFFFIAYLVASILFAAWGIYWGGLPEFSAVGIIK